MDIFKFLRKKEIIKEQTSIDHVQFALPQLPVIKEISGKSWVYYGVDNLYPQHLKRTISQSPTQGAIIKGKAGMMSGDGLLINGAKTIEESASNLLLLPLDKQDLFKVFLKNPHSKLSTNSVLLNLCIDWFTYGAYSLEIVWSMDFTRIVNLKYVEVANIRSGLFHNDQVKEYYYSRDWFYYTKEGFIPEPIPAFKQYTQEEINNPEFPKSYNQIIYVKNGTQEYYGEPHFSEGVSWVEIEGLLANFHLSNITNGFAPSMALKFYQKPGSPEEQKQIINGIKKQYAGTGNAGRAMVFFSDGKENAPEIVDIPVSNLDQQYVSVNDLAIQNILTANQVTSPLLFGISTPGKLGGGGTELETAYKIFNNSVIEPDRKRLANTINEILNINEAGIELALAAFNPLVDNRVTNNTLVNSLNVLSPMVATKVLESMTNEEIRNLIGLKPITPPINTTEPLV